MIQQLIVGSFVLCATILIHTGFFFAALSAEGRFRTLTHTMSVSGRLRIATISAALWFVAAHTVEVWLWTFVYLWLGAFATIEEAVYFTLVTFTTLGYGDVILAVEHRLLSGFTAVNGLILVGLTTAFFIEIYRSLDSRRR